MSNQDEIPTQNLLVKPSYVPEKGWFFECKSQVFKAWYDGKQIKNITAVKIEMNVKDCLPRALVTIINPDFRTEVSEEETALLIDKNGA